MRTVEAYTITEADADVTLTAGTTGIQKEVLNFRCPNKSAIKIKAGSRCYVKLLIGGTAITAGTVKLFKASVDKETHKTRIFTAVPEELDAGGTPEDTQKQFTIKRDYVLGPQEYLIMEVNITGTLPTTGIAFRLDCMKVIEWTL